MFTLQDLLTKAVNDLGAYTEAADVVTADKVKMAADQAAAEAKLASDQNVADTAASTARESAKAGIAALSDQLASLPPAV